MAVARTGVAVIGCGLIGRRRAETAAVHAATALRAVVDSDGARALSLAAAYNSAAHTDWREAIARDDIAAVVVCTPNALLVPIAVEALQLGRHVLIEKPMGRNAAEAQRLTDVASAAPGVLKIGFNHRYHPAIARAYELYASGAIGELIQLRARYGHGSRPGCEREWRADPELAGGGELLDQGVHVIDLFHWFAGPIERVHAELQTAVWDVAPLEDNAFGLLRFTSGVIGQLHVSMTQWQNLFSLEIHGTHGALLIEGLGGSYGVETLTMVSRNPQGGVPARETVRYEDADASWELEWQDFAAAMVSGRLAHGGPHDGLRAMQTVDALYAAARNCGDAAVTPRITLAMP